MNKASTRRAIVAMRMSELLDTEKQGFNKLVFGYESMISKDKFIKRVASFDVAWIFDCK